MFICTDFITFYFFHRHWRAKLPRNTDLSRRDVLIQISVANTLTPHSYRVEIVTLTLYGAFFSHWGIFIIQKLVSYWTRHWLQRRLFVIVQIYAVTQKHLYHFKLLGCSRSRMAEEWWCRVLAGAQAQKHCDYGCVKHLIKFLYFNHTCTKEHLLLRGG